MKNSTEKHAFGIPTTLLSAEQHGTCHLSDASSLTKHVGPKITDILKCKWSTGAKLLQLGGATKIYKRSFNVIEGEKLVKAFKCYLSTTTGPIAGLLFVPTDNIAFCSDKSLKFSSPTGELIKIHYKVLIPLKMINKARESKDAKRQSKKYVEIVTTDNFDFWFMGFQNHQRAFKHLQQAIDHAHHLCSAIDPRQALSFPVLFNSM